MIITKTTTLKMVDCEYSRWFVEELRKIYEVDGAQLRVIETNNLLIVSMDGLTIAKDF